MRQARKVTRKVPVWREKLDDSIRSVDELKKYISLSRSEERLLREVTKVHPMSITRYYLSLIDKNRDDGPIRKMIVPSSREMDLSGTYDTSGEKLSTKAPGIQHKYGQTALILATNRCAAYCRFCFRKRLVGLSNEEILRRFDDAIRYIKAHTEITNVLITGGDPLILPTRIIEQFLKRLSKIDHLSFIRFGTRTPVAFPARILDDDSLVDTLKKYSTKNRRVYIVTHFNHPKELADESITAIDRLINANVTVNNQTVLMRGVNDNPDVLAEQMRNLVRTGVNPYYVFQCRPVKGVKTHFQVPFTRAYRVVENAKKQLDGHCKRFKYVMSHKTGKIEIVGIMGDKIYLKYHQARSKKNIGRFFERTLTKGAAWLDDLRETPVRHV